MTPAEFADSVRVSMPSRWDSSTWREQVQTSKREMVRYYLGRSISRQLSASIDVSDERGVRRRIETRDGRVTFIMLWSKDCPRASREYPAMQNIAQRLQGMGARVLAVSGNPSSVETADFLTIRHNQVDVLYDDRGEFRQAIETWAYPAYVIIDQRGRLRFRDIAFRDIVQRVAAIQAEHDSF
jgi:hypothetical protein